MKSADKDDDQQMENIFDAANKMETLWEIRIDDSAEIRNLENAKAFTLRALQTRPRRHP